MMEPSDLKSRAGQLLYRELPEEYRYRDPAPEPGELGDLEAYLHGFGHLLDLIRGTTEQAYADAFAETADNGREIQAWLIPYLAELVGAELRAPDPPARRRELNETVAWYKSKGTLTSVDEISDVISGAEAVVVEGWRRTLTTPRMTLPPFTSPAVSMGDGSPMAAPGLPQGTPDIRYANRAAIDEDGANPLYAIRVPQRDDFGREIEPLVLHWQPRNRRGAPCFPGAYDDTSLRSPDLRAPTVRDVGPHPNRTIVHVRPPEGFFASGLNGSEFAPTVDDIQIDPDETAQQPFGPQKVFEALGLLDDETAGALMIDGEIILPDSLVVEGNLTIPAGTDILFHDLIFTGALTLDDPETRLTMNRCAAERVVLNHLTNDPALTATDCLFNTLSGGVGFAQLIYCTVMESTELERIWASDCIFNGPMVDLDCSGDDTCIRYSRVPSLTELGDCGADKSPTNTDDDPNFIRLWFEAGDDCILRPALYGEPGAGVLDLTSSDRLRAEDEGEMGAHHHMFHVASIRALELKLTDYLPLGQEISIRYDPYLSRPPVRAE
ncbi:hypothetical protein KG088_17505 [Halomonas sp. TRM85114]|uniref:hypothetical protein n=1 Tax=Halomonas jincaotanensis TaxID=2810616 RepID=UPI001BD3D7D5|nr:hypothetical protein [Halomonas jincaotanensis]MBS9405407.1 hypothetical protein [Halomonas jincaotanensis]